MSDHWRIDRKKRGKYREPSVDCSADYVRTARTCLMGERVRMRPPAGRRRCSERVDGALHITPNTPRMLGTGYHGATPIRLEKFDTRNIWKLKVVSIQELEYPISKCEGGVSNVSSSCQNRKRFLLCRLASEDCIKKHTLLCHGARLRKAEWREILCFAHHE